MLYIAVTNRWVITGCDIGNAYLEALTNRELYMKLPSDWCGKDENGSVSPIMDVIGQLRYLADRTRPDIG